MDEVLAIKMQHDETVYFIITPYFDTKVFSDMSHLDSE